MRPRRSTTDLCDELVKLANDAVVGDGFEQGTQMGPLQNKMQFEKVKGFLEDAHKNGNVIAGGAPLDRRAISSRRPSSATSPTTRGWCVRSSSLRSCQ